MSAADEPTFAEHRGYSTDLLSQITADAAAEYALPAGERTRSRPHRLVVALALLVIGLLLGASGAQTLRSRPAAAGERAQLVSQVRAAQQRVDGSRDRQRTLRAEIDDLSSRHGAQPTELAALEAQSGARPVRGPGVRITLDDAPGAGDQGRILDVDLRQVVNGLWTAGAEAIAINGYRLSATTAIRTAGDAVTVDYRSLVRPYVIEAIGDPATLQPRFVATAGAGWVAYLQQNYHVRYELGQVPTLELAAGSGVELRHAKKEG